MTDNDSKQSPLVERLRSGAAWAELSNYPVYSNLLVEAADEIERLSTLGVPTFLTRHIPEEIVDLRIDEEGDLP